MTTSAPPLTHQQALARIAELEAKLTQLEATNERLEAFFSMGEAVTAGLDLEQVLDIILSQISEQIQYDSATLMLVESEQLRAVAARGFTSDYLPLNVYPASEHNSAWRVVQHKQQLIIPDTRTTEWESREGLEQIRSWMGIPLILQDSVIGVLTLDSNQPNSFTAADARLLAPLIQQVALTVENASLFERLRTQRDQMSKLQELNQAIAPELDLDLLLPNIAGQMANLLGCDFCSVWLFNAGGTRVMRRADFRAGESESEAETTAITLADHPLVQEIQTQTQPVTLENTDFAELIWPAQNLSALLTIPLRYKTQNLGFVIADQIERREAFLDGWLALAMNAANQAVLSIRAASLFTELGKQIDRLRLINQVSQNITAVISVDDLFPVLAQAVFEHLDYEMVAVFKPDADNRWAKLTVIRGRRPNFLQVGQYQQAMDTGILATAAKSGESQLIRKTGPTPLEMIMPNTDFVSGVIVPITMGNRLEAILIAASRRPRAFDDSDVWTLETLGKQAAIVAENAHLYRNANQRLSDLAVLHEAGQALISTLDLEEMIAQIMARTCAALSAEYGYALLMDEAQTEISFVSSVGLNSSQVKGRNIPLVGSVIGTVVRQGKPLLINDTASLPQFFAEIDQFTETFTRSLMIAPLQTKRSNLGALVLTNRIGANFTENNLNLLISLSQLASGAIENARLFRQVQQYSQDLENAVEARTAHLTAVNETSRAISGLVGMDELFTRVTNLTSELFNQARVSLGLRTGNFLIFQKVSHGEFEPDVVPENYRLRIDRNHIFGQVALSGQADVVETISTAELYQLDFDEDAPSTALVVPLTIGSKTTGLIVVQSRTWLASQQRDLETLQSLVSQVAVAMENSRLLQKSREMATVQERTRLARDMHDGIAQNLAYLLLQVDRCLLMVDEDNPKLEAELENISQVISRNIEELRRHIFDLRPIGLEGRSIFNVVRQTTGEFGEQLGIKTNIEVAGAEIDLSPDVESSLYRIFQEALSNIRRHANCSQIWVTLNTNPDESIEMTIKDDGNGFDPARLPPAPMQRHGFGLVSMRERVRSLGGVLEIDSAPGQGTRLHLSVPNL